MNDDTTLEFRDGRRVVPEHLYPELSLLETYRMTFDEAVREADTARMNRYLSDIQHQVVVDHFKTLRRGY